MDSNFSPDRLQPSETPLARQRYYARKAAIAHETHHFWQMLWFELARDYNAAVSNVGAFVRWIDDRHPEEAKHGDTRWPSKNDPP
jgi:hypothetical protein